MSQRLEHLTGTAGQPLMLMCAWPFNCHAEAPPTPTERRRTRASLPLQAATKRPLEGTRNRGGPRRTDTSGRARFAAILIVERGMGRQSAPDNRSGQAQLIQQLRRVLSDSAPKHIAFPGGGGHFVSLQLLDYVKRAVRAMQLCARLHVLPVIQEPHEVAGVHRLDLAAQPAERHPVNAGQHSAIAPFDLAAVGRRRCRKTAAQYLSFSFEPEERSLHYLGRQPESLPEIALRLRPARFQPPAQGLSRGRLLIGCGRAIVVLYLGAIAESGRATAPISVARPRPRSSRRLR